MNELEDILETATEIAERAAELAYSYFRKPILIEMKENQTPVTVADKKTEEFIRKSLWKPFPVLEFWERNWVKNRPIISMSGR